MAPIVMVADQQQEVSIDTPNSLPENIQPDTEPMELEATSPGPLELPLECAELHILDYYLNEFLLNKDSGPRPPSSNGTIPTDPTSSEDLEPPVLTPEEPNPPVPAGTEELEEAPPRLEPLQQEEVLYLPPSAPPIN